MLRSKVAMAHRLAGAVIIVLIAASFIATAYYLSYRSIRVTLDRVDFASPPLTLNMAKAPLAAIAFIATGDALSLLGVVESVNLKITLGLENPGFLALPLGPIRYELYMNDLLVAKGSSDRSVTIPPRGRSQIEFIQATKIPESGALASSIVRSRGILRVKVQGTVEVGGFLPLQVPFSEEESIDITQEVKTVAYQIASTVTRTTTPTKRLTATVEWLYEGSSVTTVVSGAIVTVQISIASTIAYSGTIVIDLRKDLAGLPDQSVQRISDFISLGAGEVKRYSLTLLTESPALLRGYFVEVRYDGEQWTMSNSYPPRLAVTQPTRGRLGVLSVTWFVGGREAYVARVGETVVARVVLRAEGGKVSGTLWVRIRKDTPFAPDTDFTGQSYSLDLAMGTGGETSLSFVPDKASGTDLRGYFIRVFLDGVEIWEMPNSYPPRLRVESIRYGSPQVSDAYWTIGGVRVTQAKVGDTVYARVVIKAIGGAVEGELTIRVRKDRVAVGDIDHTSRSFHISLAEGQSVELSLSFTADQKSSLTFRGFFIQVDLTSWSTSWTMPSSYPPRLKVV